MTPVRSTPRCALAIVAAILCAIATAGQAQTASGGASGGGAIEGGSGAPGSGTGIPGVIAYGPGVLAPHAQDGRVLPSAAARDLRLYVGLYSPARTSARRR
jgi:hypothetical protein